MLPKHASSSHPSPNIPQSSGFSAENHSYATPAPLPAPPVPLPTPQEPLLAPLPQSSPFSAPINKASFAPNGYQPQMPESFRTAPQVQENYSPAPQTQADLSTAQSATLYTTAPATYPTSPPAFYVSTSPQGPFYPAFTPMQAPSVAPPAPQTARPAPSTTTPQDASASLKKLMETIQTLQNPAPKPLPPLSKDDANPETTDEKLATVLSDVGKQVLRYTAEVHDCTKGPQSCAVIDLHQSLTTAKSSSEHLNEIAKEESENGFPCKCFVEFDERFFIARYTFFGSTSFLMRCLKLIG